MRSDRTLRGLDVPVVRESHGNIGESGVAQGGAYPSPVNTAFKRKPRDGRNFRLNKLHLAFRNIQSLTFFNVRKRFGVFESASLKSNKL